MEAEHSFGISQAKANGVLTALSTYAMLKNRNEDRKNKLQARKMFRSKTGNLTHVKRSPQHPFSAENRKRGNTTHQGDLTREKQKKTLILPAGLKSIHRKGHSSPEFFQEEEMQEVFNYSIPDSSFSPTYSYMLEESEMSEGPPMGLASIPVDQTPQSSFASPPGLRIIYEEDEEADGDVQNVDIAPLTLDFSNMGMPSIADKNSMVSDVPTLDAQPSFDDAKMYSDFENVSSFKSTPTENTSQSGAQGKSFSERDPDPPPDLPRQSSWCSCFCGSSKEKEIEEASDPDCDAFEVKTDTERTIITVNGEPALDMDKGIYDDLLFQVGSEPELHDGGPLPLEDTSDVEMASILRIETLESAQQHNGDFAKDPKRLRIEHMWTLDDIGAGAGGVVSAALHMPMCRVYALKTTQPHGGGYNKDSPNSLVENEMKLFFWIRENLPNCPQLVKYHECFIIEDTKQFAIVMDLMDLGSLKDFMSPEDGKWFNVEQLQHITRETCLGLQALHNCQPKPLCHRDIKPDNILISSSGSVRLADYGLVYQLDSPDSKINKPQGTQKYMSPECYQSDYGLKSDIWSLGITLFEIATGEILNDSELEYFKIIDPKSLPTLRERQFPDGSEFPEDLVDFVDFCLQINQDERPSVDQLLGHPFISQPLVTAPQFAKKDSSYQALEKMVEGLLLWINQSKELLGINDPFPQEVLHPERVHNIMDYTKFTLEDLHTTLRRWTDKEKTNMRGFDHAIRVSKQ